MANNKPDSKKGDMTGRPTLTPYEAYVKQTKDAGHCRVRMNSATWAALMLSGEKLVNEDRQFVFDDSLKDSTFIVEKI